MLAEEEKKEEEKEEIMPDYKAEAMDIIFPNVC